MHDNFNNDSLGTCILISILACISIVALYFITYNEPKDYYAKYRERYNNSEGFSITSPAFTQGANIPDKYTCVGDIAGKNFKIPIQILDPPFGTKSFALVMSDSDASNFIHWIVWNIKPNTQFFDGSNEDFNVGYNSTDQET